MGEVLSEKRKEITHFKLNWESDSPLSGFGHFFSVFSTFPNYETSVAIKSLKVTSAGEMPF